MNKAILEAIDQLNKHQGKGYKWPANIDGSIGDVLWDDKIVLRGNQDDYTYCCGITLQAYLMACTAVGKHIGSHADVMNIRKKWFIADVKKGVPLHENRGPLDALEEHGREVTLYEALPGDPVQIWRRNGSGHSVIFIAKIAEKDKTGIKYWSTQNATNGIGYRTEYLSGVQNPVTQIHICRPI